MQEIKLLPSSEQDNRYIHQQLRQYNRQFMRDFKDYSFHIKQDGQIVAGIVAASTMDTLEVEFLFVEEGCRGQGLGRLLLEQAENLARQDGCKRVLLNTYSFQAPGFYRRMGYELLASRTPALASTASTTSPKTCERKKREAFRLLFFNIRTGSKSTGQMWFCARSSCPHHSGTALPAAP